MVLLEALKTKVLQIINGAGSCYDTVPSLSPALLEKFAQAQVQFGTKVSSKKKATK